MTALPSQTILDPLIPVDRMKKPESRWKSFAETLTDHGYAPLAALDVRVLQVNVGKVCNQTCRHCHVDAGPQREEQMSRETMELILDVLRRTPSIDTIDITGGAPEMNPHFEYFVENCRALGRHVIDRCNLTVFFVKGKEHLPQFLARHRVEIVASLPCYLRENVDRQRGQGVFTRSIQAMQRLNALGYGVAGTDLVVNVVYNPVGATLPPDQKELESDYRKELRKRFGILFNRLYTITNMPISRFLDDLVASGQMDRYMDALVSHFNPTVVPGLMCRAMVNVGWDGRLYDCDFNQMLGLSVEASCPQTIAEFDVTRLRSRPIRTGMHCYGCTAGAGSSCNGAVTG